MEIRLIRRPRRLLVLTALLGLAVALRLALLAGGGKLPATAKAAVHPAKHAAIHHAVVHHSTHHAVRHATNEPVTGPDTDNVQSGDQTPRDRAGTASSETPGTETESSVESEQGQPGEPTVGHADTG